MIILGGSGGSKQEIIALNAIHFCSQSFVACTAADDLNTIFKFVVYKNNCAVVPKPLWPYTISGECSHILATSLKILHAVAFCLP